MVDVSVGLVEFGEGPALEVVVWVIVLFIVLYDGGVSLDVVDKAVLSVEMDGGVVLLVVASIAWSFVAVVDVVMVDDG